jgi:hypothetical protein
MYEIEIISFQKIIIIVKMPMLYSSEGEKKKIELNLIKLLIKIKVKSN